MKAQLKDIFAIPAHVRDARSLDLSVFGVSFTLAFFGQALQYPGFFEPMMETRFWRHHFTNCFDVPMLASMLNIGLSSLVKRNSCPVSAAFAIAVGGAYELDQALMPSRSLDYTDMSIYTASALIYCLAHRMNDDKRFQESFISEL